MSNFKFYKTTLINYFKNLHRYMIFNTELLHTVNRQRSIVNRVPRYQIRTIATNAD